MIRFQTLGASPLGDDIKVAFFLAEFTPEEVQELQNR